MQHQTTGKRPCVARRLSHFLDCAEGPSCETEAFPERTSVMSKKITTATPPTDIFNKEQGWHHNTHLGVNVKTVLNSDRIMRVGKDYQGVLKRDVEIDEFRYDEHFTFVETLPWSMKRNPRVYNGRYISVTRQDNGNLRPNFKPMKMGDDFSLERYALGVYNELCIALGGLVEE